MLVMAPIFIITQFWMFALFTGIGMGMLSGNTRSRRVPYSYDRKRSKK